MALAGAGAAGLGWRSWLSLVGVIWLQSINGTNSNFPAYSSQLKQELSLSQLQLNNLALASDAGKLFGWCAGMAAIYLPLWLVLVIGSSLSLIGYGVQYLFLTHQIPSLSYWHLFFLTVVAGNGICWINTVCYLVIIHNFPDHRQAAVGLTTSYLGLSAVIYTALVGTLFSKPSKRAQGYMLLNAVVPLLISIMTAPFVRYFRSGKPTKKVEVGFLVLLLITIATGIYAVASSLGPMLRMPSGSPSPWVKVLGLAACLMTPLLIPLAECVGDAMEYKFFLDNRERQVCDLEITTAHRHHADADADGGGGEGVGDQTKEDNFDVDISVAMEEEKETTYTANAIEEIGVRLMLKRLNFWLYFLIYLFGATLGLVYVNNLGQIAESRGYSRTSSLVSLASAFVFFGRLLPSILDYIYSRKGRRGKKMVVAGPGTIVAVMGPMAGAFFILVNGSSSLCLMMSTGIIGMGIGVITAISVSTTSELFGAKDFGVNHNVVVANIPLGSFLFGDLAALVYRSQGHAHGTCLGLECYRMTFLTWGSLCSLGALLGLVLHFRTRRPPSPSPSIS